MQEDHVAPGRSTDQKVTLLEALELTCGNAVPGAITDDLCGLVQQLEERDEYVYRPDRKGCGDTYILKYEQLARIVLFAGSPVWLAVPNFIEEPYGIR